LGIAVIIWDGKSVVWPGKRPAERRLILPTLVFLLDVDNTLLANDDVKEDWDRHLKVQLGERLTAHFWDLYEQARHETDVVNIPLALDRLRQETPLSEMDEETYRHVHSLFDNYPFVQALYPHVLETLQHLRTLGLTVIVSDGDSCFQPEKISESGLAEAVEGRVLIYKHKQEHLDEIKQRYPADHYVVIDDKPQILVDIKHLWGKEVTTVLVQQGKYAKQMPSNFTPDITVPHIGDLRTFTAEQFLKA
jgi:FMN phosphatase YigB (HAD superfamily)